MTYSSSIVSTFAPSTGLGERHVPPIRSRADIAADAGAALAYSLDSNDFDLTAEVLLTWPMLRLAWSPVARFAFGILAQEEDRIGFLPGLAFDPARYEASVDEDQLWRARSTSYHASYVMGFLCAAALRVGCAPRLRCFQHAARAERAPRCWGWSAPRARWHAGERLSER